MTTTVPAPEASLTTYTLNQHGWLRLADNSILSHQDFQIELNGPGVISALNEITNPEKELSRIVSRILGSPVVIDVIPNTYSSIFHKGLDALTYTRATIAVLAGVGGLVGMTGSVAAIAYLAETRGYALDLKLNTTKSDSLFTFDILFVAPKK